MNCAIHKLLRCGKRAWLWKQSQIVWSVSRWEGQVRVKAHFSRRLGLLWIQRSEWCVFRTCIINSLGNSSIWWRCCYGCSNACMGDTIISFCIISIEYSWIVIDKLVDQMFALFAKEPALWEIQLKKSRKTVGAMKGNWSLCPNESETHKKGQLQQAYQAVVPLGPMTWVLWVECVSIFTKHSISLLLKVVVR